MDFAAIDVETANADMASICQVGIARFSNGALASEWKSYVDPQGHFDEVNVSVHGIDASIVAGAPTFHGLVGTIRESLNGQVVVTHTAFDKVALYQAGAKCKAEPFTCSWLDSACIARRTWKEFSQRGYGLQSVCASIGYRFKPHDALEDAKAAGAVVLAAMTQTGLDLNGWLTRIRQPTNPSLEQRTAREGNPDGELYGEVLVFTGSLTIPRKEAADAAAKVGCEVGASVTKHTTILVVGDQDVLRLAGHEKSAKHRKAEQFIQKGQPIRIIRETDFRELLKLST
jgi:DNA polymerase-3 subunit epsilon